MLLGGTGCAADVSTDDVGECSPNYTVKHKKLREITLQQEGRNRAVSWGFKTKDKYSNAQFELKVYADGRKMDGKNQNYAPHGSLSAFRAKKYSGKIFQIKGTAEKDGDKLTYDIRCYIA